MIIHSHISLPSRLVRLKPQAENVITEEQKGFRAGRSTTEQIFSLRILCEKYHVMWFFCMARKLSIGGLRNYLTWFYSRGGSAFFFDASRGHLCPVLSSSSWWQSRSTPSTLPPSTFSTSISICSDETWQPAKSFYFVCAALLAVDISIHFIISFMMTKP